MIKLMIQVHVNEKKGCKRMQKESRLAETFEFGKTCHQLRSSKFLFLKLVGFYCLLLNEKISNTKTNVI